MIYDFFTDGTDNSTSVSTKTLDLLPGKKFSDYSRLYGIGYIISLVTKHPSRVVNTVEISVDDFINKKIALEVAVTDTAGYFSYVSDTQFKRNHLVNNNSNIYPMRLYQLYGIR